MTSRRTIAVLTSGRQDWGILRSTCAALRDDPRFHLSLWTGGMHEAEAFGRTRDDVVAEGFTPAQSLAWIEGDASAAAQSARALVLVHAALERVRPEALVLVGDRFETAIAATAATLARVPIVHLHGGEETEGAFDNAFRHAITKMSHLHLVSCDDHARRVVQMGEPRETVHVVGAPGLDNLHRTDLAGRDELESHLGIRLESPLVLVTHHPATLGADPTAEVAAVVDAMREVPATYVITLPNADPGHAAVRDALVLAGRAPMRVATTSLGERRYWGLMRIADAMLGNSSSAIVEAPALGLPAVNVGDRQKGRARGTNVIDVPPKAEDIAAALRVALSDEGRRKARSGHSLFGDGKSARRIVDVLAAWVPPRPLQKRFVDIPLDVASVVSRGVHG
jgi:UDP-hydrolysing UDP-N-acetyl-D-glucosamine 2-epimerase